MKQPDGRRKMEVSAAFALVIAVCTAVAGEKCLECHTVESAKSQKTIDIERFRESVHESLECSFCHGEMEKHIESPTKPVETKVDCSVCHEDEQKEVSESVHFKDTKCWDCHGSHSILPKENIHSTVSPYNLPETCGKCHRKNGELQQYLLSAHSRALIKEGLSTVAVCVSCHGSHNVKKVGSKDCPVNRSRVPETCGKCHRLVTERYYRSVHGSEFKKRNTDVPVCTDCHGEHFIAEPTELESSVYPTHIPETCGRCHGDEKLASRYAIPVRRVATYKGTFHGLAVKYGDVRVANCASCHGYHEILPSSDPDSTINPKNLGRTCGNCHPGASKRFAGGKIHSEPSYKMNFPAYLVKLAYQILIVSMMGIFGIMILIDLTGWLTRRRKLRIEEDEELERLSPSMRLQHIVLIVSFFMLVLTGAPFLLPDVPLFKKLFFGRFHLRGLIHRVGATMLISLAIYHTVYILLWGEGRKEFLAFLPRASDIKNTFRWFGYNMGLTPDPPQFGKYSFIEKFEYFAVVWGSIIMIVTGLLMWLENIAIRFIPMGVIEVIRVIHGYEATLAFLTIIFWHFYNVMFSPAVFPMSKVWLTGKMTKSELLRIRGTSEYI